MLVSSGRPLQSPDVLLVVRTDSGGGGLDCSCGARYSPIISLSRLLDWVGVTCVNYFHHLHRAEGLLRCRYCAQRECGPVLRSRVIKLLNQFIHIVPELLECFLFAVRKVRQRALITNRCQIAKTSPLVDRSSHSGVVFR